MNIILPADKSGETAGIHKAFEAQAARTPDAAAVVYTGDCWTYRQLNERANQLAGHLILQGAARGDFVALFLNRSPEMIAAILATLKIGAAYVPIDLAYPPARVASMLEDTQPAVIITTQALSENLPPCGAPKLELDRGGNFFSSKPKSNIAIPAAPEDAAYVIFTSGSTGKPKGVVITHQNVLRLFKSTARWFHFNERDVWTFFHSYAFDFSVWEIWGALLHGGRLVIVPYSTSRQPEAFHELLRREGVTVLNQTPSAFRQLIHTDETSGDTPPLKLRLVIFGGEALVLESLRPWFARHGDSMPQLVNMYGITETTVHVTCRHIKKCDLDAGLGSVIGEPIDDLELLLLDENLRPTPLGASGEICVGGAGLAREYLKRPELTREKFISHPFKPDARLYRSGDLARRLPNGELEYLGRMDHQLKIRGFRIEPGEIETALQQHPRVRECVVIAHGQSNEARLVAYVVAKGGTPTISQLREFLSERVPGYMIPAAFVFLDAIPLTPNGKTNRGALPEPEHTRPELSEEYAPPSTKEEQILAEIWGGVLGIDHVGARDNFFELGGDSIRSIQIVARARERGLGVSLERLFEHPTIEELARNLEKKNPEAFVSKEPFSMLSEKDRAKIPSGLEDAYPMTRLQAGMVFHSDLDPASAIFHDVFSFRLKLPFDEKVLRKTVERLARRHAIFRTSFDLGAFSEPLQLVHKQAFMPVTIEDLRDRSEEEQRQLLTSWVETEKRNRFEWNVPPLARLHAQRWGDESFQLIVSFHHAVMDGWSLAAMLTELFQDYNALLTNGTSKDIAPPQIAYRDFVSMERDAMASEKSRAFWANKLSGATAHSLPRWPKSTRTGGREQTRGPEVLIPSNVLESLVRLSHSLRTPLRTVLLAAHLRVINYLTGRMDLTVGLVTNGRPQETDGEKMIGLFLNTLPVRVQLNGGTWTDLIRQTFEAEKEIIPHRRSPLVQVQQLTGGEPLFETAFDFVQFHVYRGIPGYSGQSFIEDHYFEANNFNFYTTFMLSADSSELQLHFDYNPNEFCAEQISLMCDYYVNALSSMAFSPGAHYETVCLLAAREQKRLVENWNATRSDFPDVCVHELFESQAARTPDAPAATFEEKTLTYRQLDEAANTLAERLRRHGVKPNELVGIHCERSLEMLIGILGVLKAGGAYVPLDPSYPAERIEFMMSDAELEVILTQEKLRDGIQRKNRTVLCVDSLESLRENSPETFENPKPENIAYTIYTSGSTGRPKGVQVSHRNVVNFLTSMERAPGLTSTDVLLAVTTLCFDIAGLELWLPLTIGARVVIAGARDTTDFPALARLLERCGATVMQATPTTWRGLVESGWRGDGRLKALCGGEALPRELAGQLLERCGEVWNMYGPTETTIWSTIHRLEGSSETIPIGRPVANTQVRLFDMHSMPVPTGSEGEICIGGAGVAHGYLKRPELTAKKFAPDPFAATPGARIYHTGDMGRHLPDGTLVCAGRVDQQVKIRGHRIEPGEIETILDTHPGVAASVVAAFDDASSGKQLAAYWIPRNGQPPPSQELRTHLAERLPASMVPSQFIQMEKLPLTPNGKIDRQRLPAPEPGRAEMAKPFAAPRTPLEESLARAWSEVLKIESIGIHDDFFDLGGHSLSAMQVIARLRNQFDVRINVASFFEMPTIEEFALFLAAQMVEGELVEAGAPK